MDLDSLIGELRTVRSAYPGRKVKIATHRQIKAMTGKPCARFVFSGTPWCDDCGHSH